MLTPNLNGYSTKENLKNRLRCYVWALLHSSRLNDFNFSPCIYRTYRIAFISCDIGIIKINFEVYTYEFDICISEVVWNQYCDAFNVPQKLRERLLDTIPF